MPVHRAQALMLDLLPGPRQPRLRAPSVGIALDTTVPQKESPHTPYLVNTSPDLDVEAVILEAVQVAGLS